MTDRNSISHTEPVRYRVTGMDCASCAAKIEKAARSVGIEDVKVSTATQIMTLHADATQRPQVEQAVTALGYQLDRLDVARPQAAGDDDCVTTIRIAARIASPEMLPKDLSFPQLKCSPAVDSRGSRDEAGEYGDTE